MPAIVAFRGHEVVASYDPEVEKSQGYGDKRKALNMLTIAKNICDISFFSHESWYRGHARFNVRI